MKYYTKEMFRLINLVAIALFIIMAVVFIKYKPVFEITVDGEKLGYITSKEQFEQSINEFVNEEKENKLYTTIAKLPEYTMKFVQKDEQTSDDKILAKIKDSSETMYKLYAVTIDGKKKATVTSLEEAEKLVKELNNKYGKKSNKNVVAIEDVITKDNTKNVVTIKTAKANITKILDKKTESSTTKKTTTTKTTSSSSGSSSKSSSSTVTKVSTSKATSLNGVKLTVKPLSGIITSRFGRESIRSSGHTGLDIAAPKGTAIKAAASGTVIFSGTSGGYGQVVKISHGNGIKTYYGHCSKLYVKEGQKVSAGDIIAAVGSTGNSTGNHLHFEIVKNGVSINPQNYLY